MNTKVSADDTDERRYNGNRASDIHDCSGCFRLSRLSEVSQTINAGAGLITIRIRDTGTGMPAHIKRRIFEPFVTYGKKNGTGLGMAIVKTSIERHGGTIDVDSTLGKGTVFTIHLPVSS